MKDYRTDIQSVRALGIVLIVVFHVWGNKVSGGVDVLFVVSGYFAVRTLVSGDPGRLGPRAILASIARVAARTFPAAFIVIGFTVAVAAVTLGPLYGDQVVRHAAFSLLQIQNINLAREGTDYLAREAPPSLFQHYWALSLQFQFFVALPIGMAITALIWRSLFRKTIPLRILLAAGFVAVGVLSFAFAWREMIENPGARYFDFAARLWQFMVGGVLALAKPRPDGSGLTGSILRWLGLAAILACPLALPKGTLFPLPGALLPVAGAALVIWAGPPTPASTEGRILGYGPTQVLAQHSYAIYLVHWPILVFYMQWAERTSVPPLAGLGVIVLSCILAVPLHRWGENMLRPSGERGHTNAPAFHPVLRGAALAAFPLLALTGLAAANEIALRTARANLRFPNAAAPIASAPKAGQDLTLAALATRELLPEPYSTGCHQTLRGAEVKVCAYGRNEPEDIRVALVGGSHALQWLPALVELLDGRRMTILNVTKGGCVFGGSEGGIDLEGSCQAWNGALLPTLKRLGVDFVVTTATRPHPRGGDQVPRGYLDAFAALSAAGIGVLGIRDNPWLGFDVPPCVYRHSDDLARCAVTRAQALSVPSPLTSIVLPSVRFVDLSDYFCDREVCPAVNDGVVLYRDRHHLSVPFARSLAPALAPELDKMICERGRDHRCTSARAAGEGRPGNL